MSLSDSMFLFEIAVEELESFVNCEEFSIKSQFADVFTLDLENPSAEIVAKRSKIFTKRKSMVRKSKEISEKNSEITSGQSILFAYNINSLIFNMKEYPMEISLWSKLDRLGSTHIPWNSAYIDYLNKLNTKHEPISVTVRGEYNVFNELTSKRMATIAMKIKLTYLTDKITTHFKPLPEGKTRDITHKSFNKEIFKGTIHETNPLKSVLDNSGTIKTTFSSDKGKVKRFNLENVTSKNISSFQHSFEHLSSKESSTKFDQTDVLEQVDNDNVLHAVPSYHKSFRDEHTKNNRSQIIAIKSKSCSSLYREEHFNTLNNIFGDRSGPFGSRIYQVGYFTVQSDSPKESLKISSKESSKSSKKIDSSDVSEIRGRYKFQLCDSECPSNKNPNAIHVHSVCSLDLPADAAKLISVTKCQNIDCDYKKHKELASPPDDRILLDYTNIKRPCCDVTETVEEILGGMKTQMKFGDDPCYCTCKCEINVTKRTTYCTICGGYEKVGDEMTPQPGTYFPCPIFHKLLDKKKSLISTSGSESKGKKGDDLSQKSDKKIIDVESEKDSKKSKKKKKDDRFKFNYGYKGIPPQIGHSQCASPCTGTLGAVPKHMGWLWTAEGVPGMKFRPMWKPGAINKHVVRLLRMAKNPGQVITKKKRKDIGKKKRPLQRPLLVVHKKDGEYTITMETMKSYTKARALNQQPYEDKPPLTYTIGRTDEENRERQKKKERQKRRLERAQREFIQSTFRDMCKEICLKTYQQALGILPGMEDPECTCFPAQPDATRVNVNMSCSCSEDDSLEDSDTDSDEWIIEFTPPSASFDPTFKPKKVVKVDNASHYNYLDFRVKLADRFGHPVPRFFKGPDGKLQCSDLGGFWSPDKKWLEINIDGYVAPDNRWSPMTFIGPNGEQVDCETGKFQTANGQWFVVGVDGYVDSNGKWRSYPRPKADLVPKKQKAPTRVKGAGDKKDAKGVANKPSDGATWSCFGDASPKELSKLGVIGHGHDKRLLLDTLKEMMARGENVIIPQRSTVPRLPQSKRSKRHQEDNPGFNSHSYFMERTMCRHPVPSEKGVISVDEYGNKTYFKLKNFKNTRAKERLKDLKNRGISLSSFHIPCFRSFIDREIMKQEQRERLLRMTAKNVAAQIG